ncbi:GNAT family N-acetyltransferase [Paenibacillus alvei]|uniref:Ribosomal-protein-alanine N-acetyltransferase n=1 Tax=Paenibacillus alvei TaxID=44250 RepID=A0A383RAC9_PAEAL
MTEALNRIVAFGFEEMQLNRIEAYVFGTNTASQKLLEKSGFNQEGLLQECYRKNDSFIDAILFAKLQKDYAENVNNIR